MILASLTMPNGSSTVRWNTSQSVRIDHGTLCNRSSSLVTVTLEVSQRGGGTACTVSGYGLAAGDTLSLAEVLVGATLDPQDFLRITTTAANAIDLVITGTIIK